MGKVGSRCFVYPVGEIGYPLIRRISGIILFREVVVRIDKETAAILVFLLLLQHLAELWLQFVVFSFFQQDDQIVGVVLKRFIDRGEVTPHFVRTQAVRVFFQVLVIEPDCILFVAHPLVDLADRINIELTFRVYLICFEIHFKGLVEFSLHVIMPANSITGGCVPWFYLIGFLYRDKSRVHISLEFKSRCHVDKGMGVIRKIADSPVVFTMGLSVFVHVGVVDTALEMYIAGIINIVTQKCIDLFKFLLADSFSFLNFFCKKVVDVYVHSGIIEQTGLDCANEFIVCGFRFGCGYFVKQAAGQIKITCGHILCPYHVNVFCCCQFNRWVVFRRWNNLMSYGFPGVRIMWGCHFKFFQLFRLIMEKCTEIVNKYAVILWVEDHFMTGLQKSFHGIRQIVLYLLKHFNIYVLDCHFNREPFFVNRSRCIICDFSIGNNRSEDFRYSVWIRMAIVIWHPFINNCGRGQVLYVQKCLGPVLQGRLRLQLNEGLRGLRLNIRQLIKVEWLFMAVDKIDRSSQEY